MRHTYAPISNNPQPLQYYIYVLSFSFDLRCYATISKCLILLPQETIFWMLLLPTDLPLLAVAILLLVLTYIESKDILNFYPAT